MSEWPMVKLGEVISRVDETEQILKPEDETFVTLKLHGKGLVPRNIGDGKTPKSFRGFRVKLGQFIYSRIDARNGAFGIIPAELDGAVVSKDFPVYEVDSAEIMPSILISICTSEHFVNQIRSMSNGATNRQRIKEDVLERMLIPLPPLGEQKRIAEILGGVSKAIQKTKVQLLLVDILRENKYLSLSKDADTFKSLKDLGVKKITGKSIVAKPDNEHGINQIIKVSAVSSGRFIASETKPLPADYEPNNLHEIHQGDLLFARASGSVNLLGACCIVDKEIQHLYLPDKVWKLEVDEDILPKVYLLQALRGREFRSVAESHFSSSTGVKNIKTSVLMEFKIPVLKQDQFNDYVHFVKTLDNLRHLLHRKLSLLQELQKSLATRAFAGLL
jgi:putative restriction-modification system specificity determinant